MENEIQQTEYRKRNNPGEWGSSVREEMTKERFDNIVRIGTWLRQYSPLVHCITSPIAINDCANTLLALGARPIMAEHPEEVEEITAIASGLGVSLANITDARAVSVLIAGRKARAEGIPSVIDMVGVTCSVLRRRLAQQYVRECAPAVIKGNASEIRAVAGAEFGACGVDTAREDRVSPACPSAVKAMAEIAHGLSVRTGAVVLVSGEIDIVSSGKESWALRNGVPELGQVTGTGCIMNCICAAALAAGRGGRDRADIPPVTEDAELHAALYAALLMGISGELTDGSKGLGTYHIGLIDIFSRIGEKELRERAQFERIL